MSRITDIICRLGANLMLHCAVYLVRYQTCNNIVSFCSVHSTPHPYLVGGMTGLWRCKSAGSVSSVCVCVCTCRLPVGGGEGGSGCGCVSNDLVKHLE